MSRGVLLDARTGKPKKSIENEITRHEDAGRDGLAEFLTQHRDWQRANAFDPREQLHALLERESPARRRQLERILRSLDRSQALGGPFEPRASLNTWNETLFSSIATETALTAAAEAYIFPLYYGALTAGYMVPHRTLHVRAFGQFSTAATPGTFTFRLKWQSPTDAATAGVTLAASAAITPTASSTNISWRGEWYVVCRTEGTAGTLLGSGIVESTNMGGEALMPASAPAATTADTTTAKNLALTHTPSLATASLAGFHFLFESLN